MNVKFLCPRCQNSDPRYIGMRNGLPYCRRCLSFCGKEADITFVPRKGIELKLSYPLSEKQQKLSDQCVSLLKKGKNVLIHAVTGAGKTELVYHSMEMYLSKRLHVGFATPRKDVVVDLKPRIEEAFPMAEVISVYGDHNSKLEADIICLTTHQIYRYQNYFDLIILDEIDAFPYKGNDMLKTFFRKSCRGNYILLSATPSKEDIEDIKKDNGEVITLFERYHKSPLPVPEFLQTPPLFSFIRCALLVSSFLKEKKPVFVFVPTIEEGKRLYSFLKVFISDGDFVSSKEDLRRLNIERFKGNELSYLVTTSILERGVTVRNLQVIVFDCDHPIYQQATLVQIAGRVGRKIGATTGKVYFIGQQATEEVKGAIYEISEYNRKAKLL